MIYPNKHKEIVTSLMDGRFITIDEKIFEIINEQENRTFFVLLERKNDRYRKSYRK